MSTPYTTRSGVKIGIAYVPPPQPIRSLDAVRLQSALLEPRTKTAPSIVRRLVFPIWRWL